MVARPSPRAWHSARVYEVERLRKAISGSPTRPEGQGRQAPAAWPLNEVRQDRRTMPAPLPVGPVIPVSGPHPGSEVALLWNFHPGLKCGPGPPRPGPNPDFRPAESGRELPPWIHPITPPAGQPVRGGDRRREVEMRRQALLEETRREVERIAAEFHARLPRRRRLASA